MEVVGCFIFFEIIFSFLIGKNYYKLLDFLANVGVGLFFILTSLVNFSYNAFFYNLILKKFSLFTWDSKNLGVQVLALIMWELCYYFQHRALHTMKFMWKGHHTHHSSQEFNLTTTFRRSSTDFIYNWMFFIPMALLGFPLLSFIFAANFSVAWGFCTHTRFFPRIKFFEEVFVGPSSHRVHHGANHPYFNKNFGSVLIIWDRVFGTYQKELSDVPVKFGTPSPINTFNPIKVNLIPYLKSLNTNIRNQNYSFYYILPQMIFLIWGIFKLSLNYMGRPELGIIGVIFFIYSLYNFGEILDGKKNIFLGEIIKVILFPILINYGFFPSLNYLENIFVIVYLSYTTLVLIKWCSQSTNIFDII